MTACPAGSFLRRNPYETLSRRGVRLHKDQSRRDRPGIPRRFDGRSHLGQQYENGVWTYSLDAVWNGLKDALRHLEHREMITAMGLSAMMHGYLAFDRDWNLLVPFRTWQNTMTAPAAAELSELFRFNIPQRWSIAHLYQAVLNEEPHIGSIAHITTLAG